uniref:Radical SAM protein n=1 Tax=Desulfacinum infernum TaxID=35837 RepID=A0A832A6T5_9BACT
MLRIGSCLVSQGVNGPGKRFVLWFQGCRFRCDGCFNAEFWSEDGGTLVHADALVGQITAVPEIEGVTFTGGEPFLQAKEILYLARRIKSKDLTIVCYTGYLLEDILQGQVPYGKQVLEYIDILIDGRYVEAEKAPLLWRGSRNQKVHFLTQKYSHFEPFVQMEGTRNIELQIGKVGVTITGIFDWTLWERMKKELEANDERIEP